MQVEGLALVVLLAPVLAPEKVFVVSNGISDVAAETRCVAITFYEKLRCC